MQKECILNIFYAKVCNYTLYDAWNAGWCSKITVDFESFKCISPTLKGFINGFGFGYLETRL